MFWKRLNCKYYLLVISIYAVLLLIAIGCIFMQTDRVYKQLDFYKTGKYQYLYETTGSTHVNSYLHCSSVYFYVDRNMNTSILSDCLMVCENGTYNFETPIKFGNQLGSREIAITANLAKQFNLKVGSEVFSKHNIRNRIEEYKVVEILPVTYGILRVDYGINYGLIIMGCDLEYLNNTDYSYIGFSEKDPTVLIQNSGVGLVSLSNKESNERFLIKTVSAWQCGICALVILLTSLCVIIHWKNQKGYYNRLKLEGCATNIIKKLIILDMGVPGILGLFISFVLSVIILSLYNFFFSWLTSLISVVTGAVALLIFILLILQKEKKS